jgi:hypothetical protein
VRSTPAYLAATVVAFGVFAGGAWRWRQVFRRGPAEDVIDALARTVLRPEPLPVRPPRSVAG